MHLFGQPVNDDCSSVFHLGTVPYCPSSTLFTNIGATPSEIGNDNFPSCWSNAAVQNDVWFEFISSDTINDYTITVIGLEDLAGNQGIQNPQIAIYRGDCEFDGMALLACSNSEDGSTFLEFDLFDLDPNETYFIRINDYSLTNSPNWGNFELCIQKRIPPTTINQNITTGKCSGTLYDSGGPEYDYLNDENSVFSICPDFPNNQCITFGLEYYHLQSVISGFGNSDRLLFFDGPNTDAPLISELSGINNQVQSGGGGVCYEVQASSGCLTIQFISDASVSLEGFKGTWNCSVSPCEEKTPLLVDSDISAENIIESVASPLTTVVIDTIICAEGALGTFTADDVFGLDKGIVLSTGNVFDAVGPNNYNGVSTAFDSEGDEDLDYLSGLLGNGSASVDACVVELDVFVNTNELTFEYIFGSEEYTEFVGQQYNDIFALLVSGNGIEGDPGMDNQLNIATLPESGTPVQINSVNHFINWQYYRNNEIGQIAEYDGFTSDYLGSKKSLTATINVIPCNTYHLKFAISDRGDPNLDSGVFISDIKGGIPEIDIVFASDVEYFVEGCTGNDDVLQVSLTNPLPDTVFYLVNLGGSALVNTDYILNIPDTIVFLPGETQHIFPIQPINDGLDEGVENIEINLIANFGCGNVTLDVFKAELFDAPEIHIDNPSDTVYLCADSCVVLSATGGNNYTWSPETSLAINNEEITVACPSESQWIFLEGSVNNLSECTITDSIYLIPLQYEISASLMDSTSICKGDSINLAASTNIPNGQFQWSSLNDIEQPNDLNITVQPNQSSWFVANIENNLCALADSVFVLVNEFPELAIDSAPTPSPFCEGDTITLDIAEFNNLDFPNLSFQWDFNENIISEMDGPGIQFVANQNSSFRRITQNENCLDTTLFEYEVILIDQISVSVSDSTICGGEGIQLLANHPNANDFSWSPNDELSCNNCPNPSSFPLESTFYEVQSFIESCPITGGIFVNVNDAISISLPDQTSLCLGDSIILNEQGSTSFQYSWSANPPDPNLSINHNSPLVFPEVNTNYSVLVENGICTPLDTVFTIEVIPAVTLNLAENISICEGQTIELSATADQDGTYDWDYDGPDDSTITVSPIQSQSYELSFLTACESIQESIFVEVIPAFSVELFCEGDQEDFFEGDQVLLRAIESADIQGQITYEWNTGVTEQEITPTLELGQNTYSVTLTTEEGCTAESEKTLFANESSTKIPKAFTPDSDGLNDYFNVIVSGEFEIQSFKIWNRWGNLVYDNETPDTGWNGLYKNEAQASDVFLYQIEILQNEGEIKTYQGSVTLIR